MYEIKIGSQGGVYGFTEIMPLKFETLQECKASAQVLADIILGFGSVGSALMIVKTENKDGKDDSCAGDTACPDCTGRGGDAADTDPSGGGK